MLAATLRTFVFVAAFGCSVISSKAQFDPSFAKQHAIQFADSLVNAFRHNNIDEYINISYPGIIKYYGGKHQFEDFIQRARSIMSDDQKENVELLQLENNEEEWQCIVKKTTPSLIDGKKATIVSYLIGQSKDNGNNWKYFDIAFNSVENVIFIMPDVFDNLSIPQRQVIFHKDQLARY
jgi:hypothetical protein